MSMITEKDEENNESFIERTTVKKYSNKSNSEEIGKILSSNFKNDENINDENSNLENIIILPDFEYKKEKDFINQIQFDNNNKNKKNEKCQYYLFLAYYLKEIKSDNFLLEKFNKDIFKCSEFI